MAAAALDDLKVVEYATMVSGPMCGKMFADMGAEVIKIEPPGVGDEARSHPPFPADIPHPEKSGLFLYLNTSKKSVTLDPATANGSEIFKRLVREADVLIENHPPGHLESLGLGYETLHALNPRLIVTSVTPFGQSGPYAGWKGSDLIEWAMSLTGYNTPTLINDSASENPLRAPGRQADMMGATTAAAATMMALMHREATGAGQWVDVACWQAVVNTAKVEMVVYSYAGMPYSRLRANAKAGLEPSRCRDGTFTCCGWWTRTSRRSRYCWAIPRRWKPTCSRTPRTGRVRRRRAAVDPAGARSSMTWIGWCARGRKSDCR